jgi:hypothetical protein
MFQKGNIRPHGFTCQKTVILKVDLNELDKIRLDNINEV